MTKIQKIAAGLCLAALLAGGALTARLYAERKATEAADAAQRAKWESAEQAAANQAAAGQDSGGPAQDGPGGRRQVDYAFFSTNEYSEQNAFNRQQPFKNKELIYGGKRYLRHTGIRAVLLLGLDRSADDLMEERVPWEQGQTDAIFLLAHNTARNTVKTTSTITGPAAMEMELEDITTENETWYYADEEGWVQGRSHSTEIDGNEYKFNKSGAMVTDWQKDDQGDYTFYGSDGAKATGWVEYQMPASWLATDAYNNYATLYGNKAWFYLDPGNGGKAVRAQNGSYSEVLIQDHYYAVNDRGMIWLGWCKTQRNKHDDMRRYHYYAPQAGNGLL